MLVTQLRLFERYPYHDASAEWLGRWPSNLFPEHPAISIAREDEQLQGIGRLRYELYIERDGKRYSKAIHSARSFLEPVDQVSLNFQAIHMGQVLAAVRLVRAQDALFDPHLNLLVEAFQPDDIEATVVNSRFVALPTHKARALIAPLFGEVYRLGLMAGAKHCLIGTRPELVTIFERFGFRRTDAIVNDPIAKQISVLHLKAHDFDYFREIGSPLFAIADKLMSGKTPTFEVYA